MKKHEYTEQEGHHIIEGDRFTEVVYVECKYNTMHSVYHREDASNQ